MKKINEFIKNRPQNLCNMCGLCCKIATTLYSYEELKRFAENEEIEGAQDFLKLFEPYPSIEDAMKVSKSTVENIISVLKKEENYNENKLTFYKCRYIMDNNLCSIYLERPNLCICFPSSPWVIHPPDCGFKGWLFKKREEKKQYVRKLKEDILSYELTLKDEISDTTRKNTLEVINKINDIIKCYSKYGSENW